MTEHTPSAVTLIRKVVDDARDLIRDQILLARAEATEQTAAVKSMAMMFGAAAVLALAGIVLLGVAIATALADLFNVALWISYTAMAIVLALGAYVLSNRTRAAFDQMQVLPKTRASLRENIVWIQSKSSNG